MRLLIGGSPCTYWSIAQTKNRETEASGMGWELFRNYVIARDKLRPDYFLYENNKSMAAAIREQITAMLGVEPVCINSALVSAQNRQRLYWVGHRRPDGTYEQVPVEQPEDKGILLRDVLESGVCWREKSYALRASSGGRIADSHAVRSIVTGGKAACDGAAEPLITTPDGKSFCITATEYKGSNAQQTLTKHRRTMVAEPVCIKPLSEREMDYMLRERKSGGNGFDYGYIQDGAKDKACCITANVSKGVPYNVLCEPVRIGMTLLRDGKTYPVYEVRDGQIAVKGKQYPIKLADGWYIIRKLTVRECMRLQTVPETFEFPVSDSQAYKMLGNGWTVDVIAHIMSHFEGITAEPVDVLSMYDGMACGHIALDKLGANVRNYYATEIDKYAIATATHNFPDIVELGDAFNIRWDSAPVEQKSLPEIAEKGA